MINEMHNDSITNNPIQDFRDRMVERFAEIIGNTTDETEEPDNDLVNHPAHYLSNNGIEVIDVIEAFTDGLNGIEAADTGNIIKYICRWSHKNGLQDLKKAEWYLKHLIERIEKKEKENEQ